MLFGCFVVFSKVLFFVLAMVSVGAAVFYAFEGRFLDVLHALRNVAIFVFFIFLSIYCESIDD